MEKKDEKVKLIIKIIFLLNKLFGLQSKGISTIKITSLLTKNYENFSKEELLEIIEELENILKRIKEKEKTIPPIQPQPGKRKQDPIVKSTENKPSKNGKPKSGQKK